MKKLLGLLLLLVTATNAFGAEPIKSLDTELEVVARYVAKLPEERARYLRFFTTYAYPERLQEDAALVLSFWIHSMSGLHKDSLYNAGTIYPLCKMDGNDKFIALRQVPGSRWSIIGSLT